MVMLAGGILVVMLLVLLLYVFVIDRKPKLPKEEPGDPLEAEKAYGRQLEQLGYFKYTRPDRMLEVKADMMMEWRPDANFSCSIDPDTDLSADRRCYHFERHELYEKDGVGLFFQDLGDFLRFVGLSEAAVKVTETEDASGFTAQVVFDGNSYVFERRTDTQKWYLTVLELAELLNVELKRCGIAERAYVDLHEEGSIMALFTHEIHEYVRSAFPNASRYFRTTEAWREILREDAS